MLDENAARPDEADEDIEEWLSQRPDTPPNDDYQWPFDDVEFAELAKEPARFMRSAEDGKTHIEKLQAAELKKAKQQNKLRKRYFKWAGLTVIGSLVGNFGIFVTYIISQWGSVSDPVMIAWISATVVEVLGIAYIIANYLFPPENGKSEKGEADNK
ncbi:hypothetical protein ACWFRB_09115 [Rhodococcus sp. NPDC055112]